VSEIQKIRWWPALLILVFDALVTSWIWFFFDKIIQFKVINTMITQVLAILLLIIWLMFLSRLPWKKRFQTFGVVCLLGVAFASLFRIKDFSADFIPNLEFRWASPNETFKATEARSINGIVHERLNFPQFLGSDRNATVQNVRLASDWEAAPPKLIWKQPVGAGWSGFAVSENFAITQEQHGEKEMVVCYSLASGNVLWRHSDRTRYATGIGGVGPRATPTIENDRVYGLGATGILNCLNASDGSQIWQTNILNDANAELPEWGVANSPLIVDSLVVVSAGGTNGQSLLAYHKLDGRKIWAAGNDKAHYSSPMIAEIEGVRQIVIFTYSNIVGHRPENGEVLWSFPWPTETQKVAQPIVFPDGKIFVTTGYGVGSKLFQVKKDGEKFKTELIWESKRMKAKFTNVVHKDGFIYGLDDGILACLDLENGKRRWKRGRYGHGQLLLVDNFLLILSEKGNLALVEVNPQKFNELAAYPAIRGKTWNTPALANNHLLVRNAEEAAYFQLKLAK